MKIVYNVNVWCKQYIDFFVDISLPSQFVGNNLDFLSKKAKIIFLICAKKAEIDYLKKTKSFQKLFELGEVKIIEIDNFFIGIQYTTQTFCFQLAAQEGLRLDCPVMYIFPDMICSHNFFKKIYESIQNGKRALFYFPNRLDKDKLFKEISRLDGFYEKGISAQHLVKIGIKTLHNEAKASFFSKKRTNLEYIIWPLDSNTYLLKSFFRHPFFIWPEIDILPQGSIDDYYPYQAIESFDRIEVMEDSTEFAVFEVSDHFSLALKKKRRWFFDIVSLYQKNCNSLKAYLFSKEFYIRLDRPGENEHLSALKKIKRFERKILRLISLNPKVFYRMYKKFYMLSNFNLIKRLKSHEARHYLRNVVGHILPTKIKQFLKWLFHVLRNVVGHILPKRIKLVLKKYYFFLKERS